MSFIIEDNLKLFYYRGLKELDRENGFLMDTCLTAQDRFKVYLDYFELHIELQGTLPSYINVQRQGALQFS